MTNSTTDDAHSHEQLYTDTMRLAGSANGPNRYIVQAIGLQILSDARLERALDRQRDVAEKQTKAIKELNNSTVQSGKIMEELGRSQLGAAKAQVFLGIAAIIASIIIALWA